MADRGRPKNLTTLLTLAKKGLPLKSSDKDNLALLIVRLEANNISTFEELYAFVPALAQ
jgi:hypothetical protein